MTVTGSPGSSRSETPQGPEQVSPGGAGDRPAPEVSWHPTNRPWREGVVTRAHEYRALNRWIAGHPQRIRSEELSEAVCAHVQAAIDRARDKNPWRAITGSSLQGAAGNLDAAEACILRMAPDSFLRGQMPCFLAHVHRHLVPQDPRRLRLEALQSSRRAPQRRLDGEDPAPAPEFTEEERGIIVGAVRAASSEAARELMLAKSFLNMLTVASLILILLATLTAVLGWRSPDTVSLCFAPETSQGAMVVCPTAEDSVPQTADGTIQPAAVDEVMDRTAAPWDMFTVEALGLAAAAISAAVALRNLRGTCTPVGIPIALATLKLPLGSLTAVLGLLLMRGGFVPGLSALDSPPQILAWAVLFGYAQQVFTRFVDQQAHDVLDNVKVGAPAEGAGSDAVSPQMGAGEARVALSSSRAGNSP